MLSYAWDVEKADAKHGVSFREVLDFDWSTALVVEDERRDYKETRYKALGMINGRLHVLIFTPRDASLRVISLFKANARERKTYESIQKSRPG